MESQNTGSNFLNALQSFLPENTSIGELSAEDIRQLILQNQTEWDNLVLDINEDFTNPSSSTDPILQSCIQSLLQILTDFIHNEERFSEKDKIEDISDGYLTIIQAIQGNGENFMAEQVGDKLHWTKRGWNMVRKELNKRAKDNNSAMKVQGVLNFGQGIEDSLAFQ